MSSLEFCACARFILRQRVRFIILPIFIGFGQTNVQLDPTSFGNRCPGEVITFTCTTIGSPIIAWISDEYIAPGGVQLAFATVDTIGDTETSSRYLSTVATLTGNLLASQTLTSTLQLTVSAEYQVSSVTCVNVGSGDQQSANITSLGKTLHIMFKSVQILLS